MAHKLEHDDHEATGPGAQASGKKGPTPTRRQAEAANRRPLVPEDRKEARRQAQSKTREQQAKAREGLARGDDQYLRPNERGPQKRFLRDFIDSRITLGEWVLPLMFLVIFATMLPQSAAATWAMAGIWAVLALAILESIVYAFLVRRRVAEVVGKSKVEKGFVIQALTRNLQLRPLRMPKPQVKRFTKVEFTGR